jgi:hypothetical protein
MILFLYIKRDCYYFRFARTPKGAKVTTQSGLPILEVLVYSHQYRKGIINLPSNPIKSRGEKVPQKLLAELNEGIEKFAVRISIVTCVKSV